MKKIIVPNVIQEKIIHDYKNGSSVLSLSKKYGYKYDKTQSIIRENNLKIRGNDFNSKKYHNDSHIFDTIDTEEKSYWLGFLYADGCIMDTGSNIRLSLAINVGDIEHLEKFKEFLNTDAPIHIYKSNYGTEYCRIQILDKYLCGQLINKGVYIRKTEILTFPSFLDKSLVRHFIRGYIDGDGCITYHNLNKNKDKMVFALKICSTKAMLLEINNYLPRKNKNHPALEKRIKNDVDNYSITYGGNLQVLNILNYLYDNANIYLKRKYERYLLLKNCCV